MKLEIDCPKHGLTRAFPVTDEVLLDPKTWPADYKTYPRRCIQCLAEAMVQPVRRSLPNPAYG